MSILEVTTKPDWRLFHQVPHLIYKDDPNWICPLETDVADIFNPDKNPALRNGKIKAFVALDAAKRPLGRVAAFIDEDYSATQPYRMGGIGLFESTKDDEVAQELFAAAEEFLTGEDVQVIEGPTVLGGREMIKFWGLLIKGFEPPLFQESYNPPYYQQFFEKAGYQPFEQVLTLKGETRKIPIDRLERIVTRIRQNNDIRVERYAPRHIERYARDFCTIYNATFSRFSHFKPMDPGQVIQFIRSAKAILDPHLMCIVYYEDQPAGCCVLLPDINQSLKPAKGKLNLRTLPGFFLRMRIQRTFNAKGVFFGIHPKYSSKGIAAFIIHFLSTARTIKRYPFMYLSNIRAHNWEIISIYEKLNVHIDRVHLTYRKPLTDEITIQPFDMIDLKTLD